MTKEDVEKTATSIHGLLRMLSRRFYRVYLNKADVAARYKGCQGFCRGSSEQRPW